MQKLLILIGLGCLLSFLGCNPWQTQNMTMTGSGNSNQTQGQVVSLWRVKPDRTISGEREYMMPYIGIFILLLALFIAVYNVIYAVCGRKVNRWLAISNAFAGSYAMLMNGLFLCDQYVSDVLTNEVRRAYCMRPVVIVLLTTVLGNSLRMRWTNDLG